MILFCDSGSTKADWALLDGNKIAEFQTDGLNPVHLSEQTLLTKLSGDQRITGHASKIAEVFFFGAGCGSKEGKERMKDTLKKIFPYAALTVENDLMAAALEIGRAHV